MLLVLNVLHLALEITDVFLDITYFVTGFSSIVISRFLLNLRQVHMMDDMGDSAPSFIASRVSGLKFASAVIGNLGEHLEHGQTTSGSAVFQDTYAEAEDGSESDDIETPRDQWAQSKPYEEGRPSAQGDEDITTSA